MPTIRRHLVPIGRQEMGSKEGGRQAQHLCLPVVQRGEPMAFGMHSVSGWPY